LSDRDCTDANLNIAQPRTSPPASQRGGFLLDRLQGSGGRKRRFGLAGVANVLLTNLVLQLLLASSAVSVAVATMISQGLNTLLGYLIYGKMVFRSTGLRNHKPILKYLCLMLGVWALNTAGITVGASRLGLSKGIAAASMIPPMAVLSYSLQKIWVFRQ